MTTRSVIVVCVGAFVCAAAVMHTRAQSIPRQTAFIKASNAGESDQFGSAIAVSGDGNTIAVGAPGENSRIPGVDGDQSDNSADDAGAVYVYVRSSGGWVRQAYIKASNAEEFDQFGATTALSADGNTLAVGAPMEDGSAPGVNGNQGNNSIAEAGAVYVFARQGTTWSQQAYLKASNPGGDGNGDTFGFAVAISGDGNTIAVGAPGEDGTGRGIDSDSADESADGAGAVYVFTRRGSTWSQQAYVKSDSPAEFTAGDLFGYSVTLSFNGNTLAVGVVQMKGAHLESTAPLTIHFRALVLWTFSPAQLRCGRVKRF